MLTVCNRKSHHVDSVNQDCTQIEPTVGAVLAKQDKVMDMLRALTIHLDKLERIVMSPAGGTKSGPTEQ